MAPEKSPTAVIYMAISFLIISACSSCSVASRSAGGNSAKQLPLRNSVIIYFAQFDPVVDHKDLRSVDMNHPKMMAGYPRDPRGVATSPVISPDRRTIAYISSRFHDRERGDPEAGRLVTDSEIWVMGSQGGTPHKVRSLFSGSGHSTPLMGMDWMPDGKRLICLESAGDNCILYSVVVATGKIVSKTKWTSRGVSNSLVVSPDGTQIAYSRNVNSGSGKNTKYHGVIALRTIRPNGFGSQKVIYRSSDKSSFGGICWLSSHELVFVENQPVQNQVVSVNYSSKILKVDTGTKHLDQVITSPNQGFIAGPTVSPDHQYLALMEDLGGAIISINLSKPEIVTIVPQTMQYDDAFIPGLSWSSP